MDSATNNELLKLSEMRKGLDPDQVVEFARDPSTATHAHFEWDDTKAAHEHRLKQARVLIRAVVIPNENAGKPAFVNVKVEKGPVYRPVSIALRENTQSRADVVAHILSHLIGYRNRNDTLHELQPIWDAIDGVCKERTL